VAKKKASLTPFEVIAKVRGIRADTGAPDWQRKDKTQKDPQGAEQPPIQAGNLSAKPMSGIGESPATGYILKGILVLLIVALSFWFGRLTAPSTPVAKPADPGQTNLPPRQVGMWYLIIELTGGNTTDDYKEAEHIATFCTQNYHPAEPYRFVIGEGRNAKEYWGVWSLNPFEEKESYSGEESARTLTNTIGDEYYQKYGKYKLDYRDNNKPVFAQEP